VQILRLQPDCMTRKQPVAVAAGLPPRPTTPTVMHKLTAQVKKRIFEDPDAVARGFRFFDSDGGGEIDYNEFREGVKNLGLPLKKPQVVALFNSFDADGGGTLSVDELSEECLGIPAQRKPSRQEGFGSTSRSRGGSPSMPPEFRAGGKSRQSTSRSRATGKCAHRTARRLELRISGGLMLAGTSARRRPQSAV